MNYTANEMKQAIGKQGSLRTADKITVDIRILDVKQSYGVVRFLVRPIAGEGMAWVMAERVIINTSNSTELTR